MADHVRRQLREAVAAAVTGLATTGARVYQSRVTPLQVSDVPGLNVYTTGEEVVDQSVGNLIGRRIDVTIEALAKTSVDVDDVVDQIAKEVETVLASPVTVGGKALLLQYEGCDIDFEVSNKPAAVALLRYSAVLYTQRATPDVVG